MPFIPLTTGNDVYALNGFIEDEDTHEIFGRAGNDKIDINVPNGTFYISGGAGNDTITTGVTGSTASFDVDGGSGNDVITGVGGFNYFAGDGGNDTLTGSFGQFTLDGGDGNDTLILGGFAGGILEGGAGHDLLIANAQTSQFTMWGGSGNDILMAVGNFSDSHQEYNGDSGNDTILALGADDLLDGGSGHDILRGGDGNDEIWGGFGRDTFVFTNRMQGGTVDYTDVIMDADFDAGDKIQFVGTGLDFADLTITDSADGAQVAYTDNAGIENWIVLVDVAAEDLLPSHFLFV